MNTRMQFLEHALAVEGREQQQTIAAVDEPLAPASSTAQITRLEHRINALEALVNGLTEEILDMKTVTRKLTEAIAKMNEVAVAPVPPREGIRRPAAAPARQAAVPAPTVSRPPLQVQQVQPAPQQMPTRGNQMPVRGSEHRAIMSPSAQRQEISPLPSEEAQAAAEGDAVATGQFEYVMQPDGTILKRQKTKGVKNVIIAGTGFGKGSVSRSNAIRAESSAVIEAEEVQETVQL